MPESAAAERRPLGSPELNTDSGLEVIRSGGVALGRERFVSLLNRLGRKKWNVHLRARYAHGEGVAAYLARYLKGGPLKNAQLLAAEAGCVRFRYRPHRDEDDAGAEVLTLSLVPDAFLARYLAHLPPPGAQTVRGYGLYGQRTGALLDRARAALGQAPSKNPRC